MISVTLTASLPFFWKIGPAALLDANIAPTKAYVKHDSKNIFLLWGLPKPRQKTLCNFLAR